MKSTLLDLFTSKKFLAALAAVVIYVAGRFGFDVDAAALDRIFAAFLVYVGAQGIADNGKAAAQIAAATVVPSSSSAKQLIGPVAVLALVVLGFGAAAALPSCAAVKGEVANVGTAIVDCVKAAPGPIEALLVELASDAIAAVMGTGAVDWTALEARAEGQGATTGGCAFAEFVHGRPASSASSVQSLMAGPDPAIAALEQLRAHVGGVQWSTPGGVL